MSAPKPRTRQSDLATSAEEVLQAPARRPWSAIFVERFGEDVVHILSEEPPSSKREPWLAKAIETVRIERVRPLALRVLDAMSAWVRPMLSALTEFDLSDARRLVRQRRPQVAALELRAVAWRLALHPTTSYHDALLLAEITSMLDRIAELIAASSCFDTLGPPRWAQLAPESPAAAVEDALRAVESHFATSADAPMLEIVRLEPRLYPYWIILHWAGRNHVLDNLARLGEVDPAWEALVKIAPPVLAMLRARSEISDHWVSA